MQFENTGNLHISKMTLGTVQLGMKYGIANNVGKPDKTTGSSVLDAAVKGGINSFDTAEQYGDSESFLGRYFSEAASIAGRPLIITKFRIPLEEEISPLSLERHVYKCAEQSLQRLKISKIPIYLLHMTKDMQKVSFEILPAVFKRLKSDGLVDKAGISVFEPDDVRYVLDNDIYEAVQVPMNIIDCRLLKNQALKVLKEKNVIVFARSVFLQGLFFLKRENLPTGLTEADKYLKSLEMLSEREGISVVQMALSYMRNMDGITSLVIGAEKPEQVMENLRLMESSTAINIDMEEIQRLFGDVPEKILNPRLWYE